LTGTRPSPIERTSSSSARFSRARLVHLRSS
jgi:hypothetical protein